MRRAATGHAWLLAAAIAVTAACSGDDGDPGASADRPTGASLALGLVNMEGAPLASIPALRIGAEAALDYVNSERDGVQGRPVDVEVCLTNGSPESSLACANTMVARGVVAVLGGVDLGSGAALPVLTSAGIPYVGMTPLLPADFTTRGAFTLDPGGLGTAANAAYAVDELGADRVAVLHDDSPQGKQLAEVFVRPVLIGRGLQARDVRLIPEKADAADLSPAVASATGRGTDAVIVVFPPPACSRIMQAAGALRVKASMLYIGRCGDPRALSAGGAGAEGAYFFSSILNPEAHADDPDVQLYLDKIEQYGPQEVDPFSYDTARGFATTMTLYNLLVALEPDSITSSTVSAALGSAVDAPAFMGHPYTCDGRQAIPRFVSVCNTHVRIYQFTDGGYRDVSGKWTSAGAALAG